MDTRTTAALLVFVAIASSSALAVATSCDFIDWTAEESELTLLEVEVDGDVVSSPSQPSTMLIGGVTGGGSEGAIQLVDATRENGITLVPVQDEETNNAE